MAITTGDGYIASAKQIANISKTAAITSVAQSRTSIFAAAGTPGAGTLAMTTALTGVVPTDATAGYPTINAFGGSATGYLTRVQYFNTVTSRLELWDKLFGINVSLTSLATTTLSGASSYLGRCPDGAGAGTRLFLEFTTAVSATATTVTVNYTNSAGTAGRTTGASPSLASNSVARLVELPLQAGDSGVQSIQSVVVGGTVATTGAVNVIVMRPLWSQYVAVANTGDSHGLDKTGMPIVYADSAIYCTVLPNSTSTGIPDIAIEIANG